MTGFLVVTVAILVGMEAPALALAHTADFNDSHFHLTNYVQLGTNILDFLSIMESALEQVALLGIPLPHKWSFRVDGDRVPTYHPNSDAPLYYYSFTGAWIGAAYRSLPPEHRNRFDPITGFNPADMYAVVHIRRVLETFPGLFSAIGEFAIHKECVAATIAGELAGLQDPPVDRILDFASAVGLVVLIRNDIDAPFAWEGSPPAYLDQVKALFKRHPKTIIIWAHTGMGRLVRPIRDHASHIGALLADPEFRHVDFDISRDEVAKCTVSSPSAVRITADLLNRPSDRFLFGTDKVAPSGHRKYVGVYRQYEPLWTMLDPEARRKVRLGNYERIFDEARRRVHAWEQIHAPRMATP